jgi:flagellar hook assembly protein FlgD
MSAPVGNGMKMHATIGQWVAGRAGNVYLGFWGPVLENTVSVDDNTPSASGTNMISNYPNPFSMMTTINYTVPQSAPLTMRIVDMVGRDVRTLVSNEFAESGNHSIQWDAKDDSGADVGAGNYVCEMSLTINGNVVKARVPMMLVK